MMEDGEGDDEFEDSYLQRRANTISAVLHAYASVCSGGMYLQTVH